MEHANSELKQGLELSKKLQQGILKYALMLCPHRLVSFCIDCVMHKWFCISCGFGTDGGMCGWTVAQAGVTLQRQNPQHLSMLPCCTNLFVRVTGDVCKRMLMMLCTLLPATHVLLHPAEHVWQSTACIASVLLTGLTLPYDWLRWSPGTSLGTGTAATCLLAIHTLLGRRWQVSI